jgi:peptidoglycan/LPS O-acetylase OafA/YrhL
VSQRADATAFRQLTGPHGLTHQPGLDGIRGLAVAAVVAFHLEIGGVRGGYLGVSLFFTLSGVLIGTLVLNEIVTTGRFSLPAFWRRRARRLLPPALLTLAVVAVGRVVTPDLDATSGGDIVAGGLNVANWHFLANGASYAELFGGPSAVLHFWSLAIEEQFYLVIGVLAVVLAGRAARPVRTVFLVACVVAVASFVVPILTGASVDRIYYGSDTRGGELMVGVAAAAVLVSRRRRERALAAQTALALGGAAALASTIVLWMVATPGTDLLRRGLLPLTATCSVLVIVAALLPTGPVAAIARVRPLCWLGGISYALYLVHWPVVVVADRLTDSRSVARSLLIVAMSLALALLSAVAVERPVRRRRIAGRPLAFAAAAALVVVSVATVAGGRTTQSAALLTGLSAAAADDEPTTPASAGPRVALFGDSVGLSLLLSLGDATVPAAFARAPSDVRLGCGIAVSPSPPAAEPHACDDPAERFAAKAAAGGVDVAVMLSCQWELVAQPLPGRGDDRYAIGDPTFDAYVRLRYEEVANRLIAAGVDRILWTTCPYLSSTVGLDGLAERFVASRDPDRVDRLNAIIEAMAADRADVDVLPLSAWVNAHVDDAAIRPDGSHFEYRGHNPAADAFVGMVNAELADGNRRLPATPRGTLWRAARRGATGRRSPRCRRTCARCAGSEQSAP